MLHFFAVLLAGIDSVPLDFMLAKRSLQGEERVWKRVKIIFIIDVLINQCITVPANLGEAVFQFADMTPIMFSASFSLMVSLVLLFQYRQCYTQGIERLGRNSLLSIIGLVFQQGLYLSLKKLFGIGILADAYGVEAVKTILIILVSAVVAFVGVLALDGWIYDKLSARFCKAVVIVDYIVGTCAYLMVLITFISWKSENTYGAAAVKNTVNGLVIILFLAAGIMFGWILLTLQKRSLQKEVYYLRQQETLLKNYYLTLEQKNELVSQMRHDIGNYLETMKVLAANNQREEMEETTRALDIEYQQILKVDFCREPIINAIVNQKADLCIKQKIKYWIDIFNIELGNIEPVDWMTIFFNLFDNAIEANAAIPDGEQRTIEVRVYRQGNIQTLVFKNRKAVDYQERRKEIKLKDGRYPHGLGLKILKKTVSKYGGTIFMEDMGEWFEVKVTFML